MNKKNHRRQLKTGSCAYCGAFGEITRDHVVPRGLFHRPYPADMITVSACHQCNVRKSAVEDALRDFLCVDLLSARTPQAGALFDGPVGRSIRRGSSRVARAFAAGALPLEQYSPGGLYLGTIYGAHLPDDAVSSALRWIVRGLYFVVTTQSFAETIPMLVHRPGIAPPQAFPAFWQAGIQLGSKEICIGDDFRCLSLLVDLEYAASIWLLEFFRQASFLVLTNPASMLE